MRRIKYEYSEKYRGHDIFIYGAHGEWLWRVVIDGKVNSASTYYFSIRAALDDAKEYVDKKVS